MEPVSLMMIAFGLSMDAFAVACVNGLCTVQEKYNYALKVGLYFGFFQGIMTVTGYVSAFYFKSYVTTIDHWIAFLLLAGIGVHMIWQAYHQKEISCDVRNVDSHRALITFSIATSIDALAVGISLAILQVNISIVSSVIAVTTFVLSFIGVIVGKRYGYHLGNKTDYIGGFALIMIGLKILFEHIA
jgi:manganese efflux pump family protein